MEQKTLKSSLKIAANVLLLISLALMVLSIYLENFYVAVGTIALSVISIAISVLGADEYKIQTIAKDLNIYFFVVCIVISLSVVLSSKVLFYVGVVLFILMILLYLIPLFVTEKEERANKKK